MGQISKLAMLGLITIGLVDVRSLASHGKKRKMLIKRFITQMKPFCGARPIMISSLMVRTPIMSSFMIQALPHRTSRGAMFIIIIQIIIMLWNANWTVTAD